MLDLIASLDRMLLNWLAVPEGSALHEPLTALSMIGDGGVVWLALTVAGLAHAPTRAGAWRVGLTLAVAAAVPALLSLPGSNAAAIIGGTLGVSRVWPQARPLWWSVATIVLGSRLAMGHTAPSAILVGAAIGVAAAYWVLGGRAAATFAHTLPQPSPAGVIVRP